MTPERCALKRHWGWGPSQKPPLLAHSPVHRPTEVWSAACRIPRQRTRRWMAWLSWAFGQPSGRDALGEASPRTRCGFLAYAVTPQRLREGCEGGPEQ